MSDSSSEFGSFLAGFVIGGLVGAAVALVLAPQSGSETRSQIASKSQELRQTGQERLSGTRDHFGTYPSQFAGVGQEVEQEVETQTRIILDAGRKQASEIGEENSHQDSDEASSDAPTDI